MRVRIDLAAQQLELFDDRGVLVRRFRISTAAAGAGEQNGSGGTPRGAHVIRARIGAGLDRYAVLQGRRPTGECWSPSLAAAAPDRDWILGRILWLSGLEPGRNRLGDVDTMRRYIYIHGTGDDQPMGVPRSHGCIRMHVADMVELFDLVTPGTLVTID